MMRKWNPALLVGVAIAALWAGIWLIGYLSGFQGEPNTFFKAK